MIYALNMLSDSSFLIIPFLWFIVATTFYIWLIYRFWIATKTVEETSKTVEDTCYHVRLLVEIVARGSNERMLDQQALMEELKAIRAALSPAPGTPPPES